MPTLLPNLVMALRKFDNEFETRVDKVVPFLIPNF